MFWVPAAMLHAKSALSLSVAMGTWMLEKRLVKLSQ